ncbi:MAG TPA: aldehyde dehydrogenase family protein [Ktedonobacterales bacterium]|nr:aldehyde dehydrogenase family protein [Ktedonobacterales bacterium]
MEEQSQQVDVADLARIGYTQELRLAQTIVNQSLKWANGVNHGLAASVWTRDVGRAQRAARKLQFGTAWINTRIPLVNEMPQGGYKQSGYGKIMGIYSLEEYTQIKHVMASHE